MHIAVQCLARNLMAEVRLVMEGAKAHRINSSVQEVPVDVSEPVSTCLQLGAGKFEEGKQNQIR